MSKVLNTVQRRALRKVVEAKLRLRQAAARAEELLGCDIDTQSDEFDALCAVANPGDEFTSAELIDAFQLQDEFTAQEL